jgi:hypothetical protein
VLIKMNLGDTININDVLFEFVEGTCYYCDECDLYPMLDSRDECNIACAWGHMKRAIPKALIMCPSCKTVNEYERVVEAYSCNKCGATFVIEA